MTNLQNGSTGDDVKKLQTALNTSGYSLEVDGQFGPKTEAAVRDYQAKKSLAVDGIAGENTLGSLYSGNASATSNAQASTASQAQSATPSAPDYSKQYTYNSADDSAYQNALLTLQEAEKSVPSYDNSYEAQLNEIYNKIINREKFSYNISEDALYQQYKQQYTDQGKLAMMDTMGQAAALTGGYGSSYSQSVGQQQYDAYLQKLNEVIPDLYNSAYSRYAQDGENMMNAYSLTSDMANDEYSKYRDSLSDYNNSLDRAQQNADTAYDRGYNNWFNALQLGNDAENTEYERQQNEYEKLVSLISDTGYTPTSQELSSAGMTDGQVNAYKAAYYGSISSSPSSSSSKGSSSSGKYNNGRLTTEQVKELQRKLGVTEDGMFGTQSRNAAGGLSAAEAYAKYVGTATTVSTVNEALDYISKNKTNDGPVNLYSEAAFYNSKINGKKLHGMFDASDFDSYQQYLNAMISYYCG